MKNIYVIVGIIFILSIYSSFFRKYPSVNLSNNNNSKSRILDEENPGKEQTRIQKQQILNYQIIQEISKLEEEEDKRRFELSKKIIKENINKWLNFTQQNNANINKLQNFTQQNNTNINKLQNFTQQNNANTSNINYKKNKLIIPCSYSLDNNYVFPTLVSMTSLVENAGNNTFYSIYVMIDKEFSQENQNIIKTVEQKHVEHCEVFFLKMNDKYKNETLNNRLKTPCYYRLELHNLLPNINKIIYLDGDTGIFEDLTELINIDMKGNYILGFLDSLPNAIEKFGIPNATVLCSGVLLMDLDALRKNNMTEKFNKFIAEQKEKINQQDQTIINVVCQDKISTLPPKYGIWCFEAKIHALKHNNRQRPWLKYNEEEFLKAYSHPAILHYVWPKPYWRRKRPIFNKEWWDYAKRSGFLDDVIHKSPKYVKWT